MLCFCFWLKVGEEVCGRGLESDFFLCFFVSVDVLCFLRGYDETRDD